MEPFDRREATEALLAHCRDLPDREWLLAMLRYYLAPTLLAGKVSSVVTLSSGATRNLYAIWREHRHWLTERLGLSPLTLCSSERCACVLFYDEAAMNDLLATPANRSFLAARGYPDGAGRLVLGHLAKRFRAGGCPEEIGLFLGFPLADVEAYIRTGGRDYLMCRYWKVYHDPVRASQTFAAYDDAHCRMIHQLGAVKLPPAALDGVSA